MEWYEKLTNRFLRFFSQKEVKTPLSFFFRVVTALVLLCAIAMGACEPAKRFEVFLVSVAMLIFFFGAVWVFAWVNPKHLVYGEAGHRAELRFAMGTEKHEITAPELATLPQTTNTALPQTANASVLAGDGEQKS